MTEDKQEAILRKVRGLMAKAASTEFEGEREVFIAKADSLMEQYAITEIMLANSQDSTVAKLIKRQQMDVSWWFALKDIDRDARNEVYWLWDACVTHCRCYGGTFATYESAQTGPTVATYGLPSDLAYLDILFTDLFSQMVAKIRPVYDSEQTLGANIAVAKSAGMKWSAIAGWSGHPEWVDSYGKTQDGGAMLRHYKRHLKEHGGEYIQVNPKTYQYSYMSGFCQAIRTRLYRMRQGRVAENTGSMELALRDVREQAREALFEDFPHLRPHPQGCSCKACKRKTAVVAYKERQYSGAGDRAGRSAGEQATIKSNDPNLRSQRGISR